MGRNKIVPAAAGLLLLVVIFVGYKIVSGPSTEESGAVSGAVDVGGGDLSAETAEALGIEGDTEKDVVATLVGVVKGLRKDLSNVQDKNEEMARENKQLMAMEGRMGGRVDSRLAEAKLAVVKDVEAEYTALVDKLARAENRLAEVLAQSEEATKGLAELTGTAVRGGRRPGQMVWFHPEGTVSPPGPVPSVVQSRLAGFTRTGADDRNADKKGGGTFVAALNKGREGADRAIQLEKLTGKPTPKWDGAVGVEPRYTIPQNATLIGSVAMTALVGRVPTGGSVTDPYLFKAIIGSDNLAANGLEMPGVAYSIISGTAVGDWTLSCVRGTVTSMTFVFEDGVISTFPDGGGAQPIGVLSDPYGNPCVSGIRVSNARAFLTQRIGVISAQAAAEAIADAETETHVREGTTGDVVSKTTNVTGDAARYALAQAISGGTQEAADWMARRQQREFDCVYVDPGSQVAVHITIQIPIDYNPAGRRLFHKKAKGGTYRALD